MKRLKMDVYGRTDRPCAPAIGEERPALLTVDELGISLGPDQPSPERRIDRRDHQPVITPGQAARDRPRGIAAKPVGEPPLTAFGFTQIATNRPAEAHQIGHARNRCLPQAEPVWGAAKPRQALAAVAITASEAALPSTSPFSKSPSIIAIRW